MINPEDVPSGLSWLPSFFLTLFAATGGFVGYLYRTMQTGERIHWLRAIVEMLASAFIGSIVLLVCVSYQIDLAWTGVIVGISGWNAGLTVKILQTLVQKRLEVKHVRVTSDESKADIDRPVS